MPYLFRGFILLLFVSGQLLAQGKYANQPDLENRATDLLHENQLRFKDLNKNQKLDPYEDWRLPVEKRIADLLSQMTLEEKVGMLLINTLNAGEKGIMTNTAVDLIETQKMTRFIFRNTVTDNPANTGPGNGFAGVQITPYEAA